VILLAALDELGEVGYGAFTIESVAARAGVGKSTIYRHWPDKLALIAAAFETLHEEHAPDIVTGSPRERLTRTLRHVAEILVDSTFSACIPALIDGAERDRDVRKFHHHFQSEARRPLIAMIADGVASGDFPKHIDPALAALALLGAIFMRRLMTNVPFQPAQVGELINTVLGPQRAARTR
jgi:TetR/AcrR family transcriptional regulator, regulator of autoinduction and epiphytic fitness